MPTDPTPLSETGEQNAVTTIADHLATARQEAKAIQTLTKAASRQVEDEDDQEAFASLALLANKIEQSVDNAAKLAERPPVSLSGEQSHDGLRVTIARRRKPDLPQDDYWREAENAGALGDGWEVVEMMPVSERDDFGIQALRRDRDEANRKRRVAERALRGSEESRLLGEQKLASEREKRERLVDDLISGAEITPYTERGRSGVAGCVGTVEIAGRKFTARGRTSDEIRAQLRANVLAFLDAGESEQSTQVDDAGEGVNSSAGKLTGSVQVDDDRQYDEGADGGDDHTSERASGAVRCGGGGRPGVAGPDGGPGGVADSPGGTDAAAAVDDDRPERVDIGEVRFGREGILRMPGPGGLFVGGHIPEDKRHEIARMWASPSGVPDGGDASRVHHKDGPLAQVEQMAEWAESMKDPALNRDWETAGKIASNLRDAVAALKPPGGRDRDALIERLRGLKLANGATLGGALSSENIGRIVDALAGTGVPDGSWALAKQERDDAYAARDMERILRKRDNDEWEQEVAKQRGEVERLTAAIDAALETTWQPDEEGGWGTDEDTLHPDRLTALAALQPFWLAWGDRAWGIAGQTQAQLNELESSDQALPPEPSEEAMAAFRRHCKARGIRLHEDSARDLVMEAYRVDASPTGDGEPSDIQTQTIEALRWDYAQARQQIQRLADFEKQVVAIGVALDGADVPTDAPDDGPVLSALGRVRALIAERDAARQILKHYRNAEQPSDAGLLAVLREVRERLGKLSGPIAVKQGEWLTAAIGAHDIAATAIEEYESTEHRGVDGGAALPSLSADECETLADFLEDFGWKARKSWEGESAATIETLTERFVKWRSPVAGRFYWRGDGLMAASERERRRVQVMLLLAEYGPCRAARIAGRWPTTPKVSALTVAGVLRGLRDRGLTELTPTPGWSGDRWSMTEAGQRWLASRAGEESGTDER
jgi:hypothetical protein